VSTEKDDQYPADEAKLRFEATLRGALKTPPQPSPSKKTAATVPGPASVANAKTERPGA
jgi:hypothetical protein